MQPQRIQIMCLSSTRPSQWHQYWLVLQPGHQVLLHLWAERHRSLWFHPASQSDHPYCQGGLAGSDGHHGAHQGQHQLEGSPWQLQYTFQINQLYISLWYGHVNACVKQSYVCLYCCRYTVSSSSWWYHPVHKSALETTSVKCSTKWPEWHQNIHCAFYLIYKN